MADTEKLGKMLDNLIKDKGEQADINFHDYMQGKMQDMIHGDSVVDEPDNDTGKKKNG